MMLANTFLSLGTTLGGCTRTGFVKDSVRTILPLKFWEKRGSLKAELKQTSTYYFNHSANVY